MIQAGAFFDGSVRFQTGDLNDAAAPPRLDRRTVCGDVLHATVGLRYKLLVRISGKRSIVCDQRSDSGEGDSSQN